MTPIEEKRMKLYKDDLNMDRDDQLLHGGDAIFVREAE